MVPRVMPDSFVLAFRFPRCYPKKTGQMFYLNHPQYGLIIKTLARIDPNGDLWFKGEAPESLSLDALGKVSEKDIVGRIVWVISPQI